MIRRTSREFHGLLLDAVTRPIERRQFSGFPGISYDFCVPESGWEKYAYISQYPLLHEDDEGFSPPYEYPLLVRRSGPRVLVASVDRAVVEFLVSEGLGASGPAQLKRVQVAVDRLVNELVQRPPDYALFFAHARAPAFGASLRAVSFYGDDLAEASWFRDAVSVMTFHSCGLRNPAGQELLRVWSDGRIALNTGDFEHAYDGLHLNEVEKVLTFLRDNKYLLSPQYAPRTQVMRASGGTF